jgi:hypothetical protein
MRTHQMADPRHLGPSLAALETLPSHESPLPLVGAHEYTQDADANSRVKEILVEIGKQVAGSLPCKPAAILLTGSFARGEGSVLRVENKLRMLSDMEFLVVCPLGAGLENAQQNLNHLAKHLSGWLAAKAVECEIEFSAVDHNYLRDLRPAIFSYELLAHARTMWGDDKILAAARRFPASEIPRWDAWRMLNNRLLEQLQWADISPRWGIRELQSAFYHVLKCYLDMATAILIFAGQYRSRYGERAEALEAWAGTASKEGVAFANELADRVSSCTAFKLHPDFGTLPLGVDLSQEPQRLCEDVRRTIVELVHTFHQVWRWAGNSFLGSKGKSLEEDVALQDAVLRSQPLREKLRGWAKLALMPEVRRRPQFLHQISRLLFKGSPRYLIYTVASHLYFRLPDVIDGITLEMEDQERLLPVSFADRANAGGGWWRLRADVLFGWRLFLRNHWA